MYSYFINCIDLLQSHPIHSVVSPPPPGSTGSYCPQMAHTHVSTFRMSCRPLSLARGVDRPRLRARPRVRNIPPLPRPRPPTPPTSVFGSLDGRSSLDERRLRDETILMTLLVSDGRRMDINSPLKTLMI